MANAATMSIIINAKDMASKTIAGIGGSLNNLQKTANRVQRSFNDFKNSYNELARGAEIALGAIGAAGGAIFMFSKNTEKAMANAPMASTPTNLPKKIVSTRLYNAFTNIPIVAGIESFFNNLPIFSLPSASLFLFIFYILNFIMQ